MVGEGRSLQGYTSRKKFSEYIFPEILGCINPLLGERFSAEVLPGSQVPHRDDRDSLGTKLSKGGWTYC